MDYAQKLSVAYAHVFAENSPYVQDVIADLDKFCRMRESTFHADPRLHALLEGRRETALRIHTLRVYTPEQAFAYLTANVKQNQGAIK